MAEISININGKKTSVSADPATPLLWVIREKLGLTGTKYGCGIAACGACTVHVDGTATRSCVTPVGDVSGRKVTTIEGLSPDGDHPLQKAWIQEQVPQCGYCQSGQIMQAAELLAKKGNPTRQEIIEHMNGVLCRCATYYRIIKAIESAATGRKPE
jgi:isoquinoline 1-oxidoreductase alpha subunit